MVVSIEEGEIHALITDDDELKPMLIGVGPAIAPACNGPRHQSLLPDVTVVDVLEARRH